MENLQQSSLERSIESLWEKFKKTYDSELTNITKQYEENIDDWSKYKSKI